MRTRLFSFTAAFLLHFLLFAALYFRLFDKPNSAPQVVIEAEIIVSKHQDHEHVYRGKKSVQELHHAAKKDQAQTVEHVHGAAGEEKKSLPLFNPLPQIPDDLRDEAFNSEAVARFYVASDGSVSRVELIKPCANPKLNHLLLKSLKSWKFSSGQSPSTQDIRVNFLVK